MQLPSTRRRQEKGLALVIVLAFLVLSTVLIVGFFMTATNELTASKSYADGIAVRQLSDTAVNLVMGQIHNATTQSNGAWASQPGMLRVFKDANGASSTPFAYYKLYSSDKLILTGGGHERIRSEGGDSRRCDRLESSTGALHRPKRTSLYCGSR